MCYSGATFGSKSPPFLVYELECFPQLISNEVSEGGGEVGEGESSANNFTSRNATLSTLFKIEPSLSFSFLMSSMFIIIVIIRIIKTTCLDNTILMVELEEKLP